MLRNVGSCLLSLM